MGTAPTQRHYPEFSPLFSDVFLPVQWLAFNPVMQARVYPVKQHISVSKHSSYAIHALRVSAPAGSSSAKG